MSETSQQGPEMSRLEQMRAALAAKRAENRRTAEAAVEAGELARVEDELAYEEARARAYAEPRIGPDRVVGGEIAGAGFCVLIWPDPVVWRGFQDRGILKKDGLKQELCDELVSRCVRYPEPARFKAMLEKNPAASVQLATALINAMQPEDAALGKELRNSLPRR